MPWSLARRNTRPAPALLPVLAAPPRALPARGTAGAATATVTAAAPPRGAAGRAGGAPVGAVAGRDVMVIAHRAVVVAVAHRARVAVVHRPPVAVVPRGAPRRAAHTAVRGLWLSRRGGRALRLPLLVAELLLLLLVV